MADAPGEGTRPSNLDHDADSRTSRHGGSDRKYLRKVTQQTRTRRGILPGSASDSCQSSVFDKSQGEAVSDLITRLNHSCVRLSWTGGGVWGKTPSIASEKKRLHSPGRSSPHDSSATWYYSMRAPVSIHPLSSQGPPSRLGPRGPNCAWRRNWHLPAKPSGACRFVHHAFDTSQSPPCSAPNTPAFHPKPRLATSHHVAAHRPRMMYPMMIDALWDTSFELPGSSIRGSDQDWASPTPAFTANARLVPLNLVLPRNLTAWHTDRLQSIEIEQPRG